MYEWTVSAMISHFKLFLIVDVIVHVRVDRICHDIPFQAVFLIMDVSVHVQVDRICHDIPFSVVIYH